MGLTRKTSKKEAGNTPPQRPATGTRGIRLTTRSTDGAEQAAPIISQAPSASWSWQHQVIPFSGVPAWVMVGPAITLLLFVAFLHHQAGHNASPKRSPPEKRRARNCYLNLEGSAMKGPSFSYIPRKQPGVRTERDEVPKMDNSFPSSFHPPSTPPPSASSRPGVYPTPPPAPTHWDGNYFPIPSACWIAVQPKYVPDR